MFEALARYNRIVVTGPQRSGTTIGACCIAHDIGYTSYFEEAFGVFDVERFRTLLDGERVVIQCPALCYCAEQFSAEDTLIVVMVRDLDEIRASEERIGWGVWAPGELRRYRMTRAEARAYLENGGSTAAVKYEHWRERQRGNIEHWLELDYASLAGHPLWIPPEQRVGFGARQWRM